ncbi:MAG: endopeptidase La [candidate division KSB1 bacterium]|nr:endopeptidase La [candidate division KSB1 bacterium]
MLITPSSSAQETQKPEIPRRLRVLPLGDAVLFPGMILPLSISDPSRLKLVEDAVASDRFVGAFATRTGAVDPGSQDFYDVGTAALVSRMLRLPDGSLQIVLHGLARVRLKEIVQSVPYFVADTEPVAEALERDVQFEAALRSALGTFQRVVELAPNLPNELVTLAHNLPDPSHQIDFMGSHLNLSREERQKILELADLTERLRLVNEYLNRELEILEIGRRIQEDIRQRIEKTQREAYLREQLRAIQKELGIEDERTAELREFRKRVEEAGLPEEARKEAERELERMQAMAPQSPEYVVSRTYLEWLVSLPWNKETEDRLDLPMAQQILDAEHFDLEKAKERILDTLAVRRLKPDMRGPILCFVGPPGTGKTSLGRSIARALGRNFVRISLGGVSDEAEIRGHRRTYVGALPGRIIQGIRRAGSKNPVFMLDEIDKLGSDFRGDPAAALLEVLDPEQNSHFVDHYLDVPFDLSKVFFITTANVAHAIPAPLLDRMEVLELQGYTENEKMEIARRYLLPRQREEHGLSPSQLEIDDEALRTMIRHYTREAGVRNLERQIATVCRKAARRIALGEAESVRVGAGELGQLLGPPRFRSALAEQRNEAGVATGLAWTPTGGDVMTIEVATVPGSGHLKLTGRLGEVMKESAEAAMTYVRSRAAQFGLEPDYHRKLDVHIHVPEGAIPKDGPSAGITIATALVSALTGIPVRNDVAMTGEITLRGRVLAIGGVRDKVLAAHRAGIRTVLLPAANQHDLVEIPEAVRSELEIVLVDHMDQVLERALAEKPARTPSGPEGTPENRDCAQNRDCRG